MGQSFAACANETLRRGRTRVETLRKPGPTPTQGADAHTHTHTHLDRQAGRPVCPSSPSRMSDVQDSLAVGPTGGHKSARFALSAGGYAPRWVPTGVVPWVYTRVLGDRHPGNF